MLLKLNAPQIDTHITLTLMLKLAVLNVAPSARSAL